MSELAIITFSRLPEPIGTEEDRKYKLASASNLVDLALDNAAKIVAKAHTIPDAPGFKDPMRLSSINAWSIKLKRKEKE